MHTAQTIALLIERNDEAVKRAIVRLVNEGVGEGPDWPFLLDIARKLPLYDNRMTPPQYRRARRALVAYAERLADLANGRPREALKPEPAPEVKPPVDLWGLF